MKTNQRQRILQYIREFGSITSLEAYKDLGITQLGARIFELKREGYNFTTKTEYGTNRYGERMDYARYYLLDDIVAENKDHIPTMEVAL